mgnify:CR=1 FL=1
MRYIKILLLALLMLTLYGVHDAAYAVAVPSSAKSGHAVLAHYGPEVFFAAGALTAHNGPSIFYPASGLTDHYGPAEFYPAGALVAHHGPAAFAFPELTYATLTTHYGPELYFPAGALITPYGPAEFYKTDELVAHYGPEAFQLNDEPASAPLVAHHGPAEYFHADPLVAHHGPTGFQFPPPEGDRVVFSTEGDIWIMDMNGSGRTRLTSGPALDTCPRFNPAADRIAFSSDRGGSFAIWTMTPDGTDLQQVEGYRSGQPIVLDWSPGGDRFLIGGNTDQCMILDIVTGEAQALLQVPYEEICGVAWSSEGRIAMDCGSSDMYFDHAIRIVSEDLSFSATLENRQWPAWGIGQCELLHTYIGDLWTASNNGTAPRELVDESGLELYSPAAGSSGHWLLACAELHDEPSQHRIYRFAPSTGHQSLIAECPGEIESLDCGWVYGSENTPPLQPTHLQPADGVNDLTSPVQLVASDFGDPDPGDTHAATHWQVRLVGDEYDQAVLDEVTSTALTSREVSAPLVTGQSYAWRVRYFDEHGLAGPWSDETTFTMAGSAEPPVDYVIIVAGGGDYPGNPIVEQIRFLAGYAYRLSRNRSILEDHIRLLSAFDQIDADHDGDNDVDGDATLANLAAELSPGADWLNECDKLIVYLIDHGSTTGEEWFFRINEGETVSATTVAGALDNLQAAWPNLQVALVCDFCYSGGFVQRCRSSEYNRICVSGSTDASLALFSGQIAGVSFSNFFFDSLAQGADFYRAYLHAQEGVVAAYSGPPSHCLQVPWLDDDAHDPILGDFDWSGSFDHCDGERARQFYWGNSHAYGMSAPVLLEVTPDHGRSAGGVPVELLARLAPGYTIDRVWVNIIPPDTVYPSGEPITELTQVELDKSYGEETWRGSWNGFTREGRYKLVFFASGRSDPAMSESLLSSPLSCEIRVGDAYNATDHATWTLYE